MHIEDKNDWWNLTKVTVPSLKEYAGKFDIIFDEETAKIMINTEDHRGLFLTLHRLWFDLPDIPEIRCDTFYNLSEICSEYWLFGKPAH